MLPERELGYLSDIRKYASEIVAMRQGLTLETFVENEVLQRAIIYSMVIIGELSGRLAPEARAIVPNFDWQAMKGMRNILVHEYGRVNLAKGWDVIGELEAVAAALTTYLEAQP